MLVLKIGEFSQLSQVTVKTLHHYDDIGLLKPAHIDSITNYRYYTLEQLPAVHRIMALKELGLSLEQIGLMLKEKMSDEQFRGMLRLRQAEAQQQKQEVEQQLSMIEFRLRMVDSVTNFPDMDVVIKPLSKFLCLSYIVARTADSETDSQQMGRVATALNKAISDGTIQATGLAVDKFHGGLLLGSNSDTSNKHEVLIGVKETQKDVEIDSLGFLTVKEEAAVKTAATLILSNKENDRLKNIEKIALLRLWALEHGYKTADYIRVFNHRGPMDTLNRNEFILEAQLPITTPDT